MVYIPKVNYFICAEAVADLPPIPDAEAGRNILFNGFVY